MHLYEIFDCFRIFWGNMQARHCAMVEFNLQIKNSQEIRLLFVFKTDETGEKIRIELDEDDSDDDEQSEMKTDQNADASSLAVKPLVDIREFEGYEVLFDVDESVPDDALPNPQGLD